MGNIKQQHLECKGRKGGRKNEEQSGEQEWGEICWRNPIKRLRKKTSKEEYIRQLNEEIRKGRAKGGSKGGGKDKENREHKRIEEEKKEEENRRQ